MATKDMKRAFKKLYEERLNIDRKYDNKYLYHFTTYEAITNIFKGGSIYVGRAHDMQDKEEIKYCYNIAESILESYPYDKEFINLVLSRIKDDNLIFNEMRHYILSFSKNEDNFSTWKNYSKSHGVIIKVLYENVKNINNNLYFKNCHGKVINFNETPLNCSIYGDFGNVVYEIKKQERILREEIDKFYIFYKQYSTSQYREYFKNLFNLLVFRIKLISPYFKNASYENEDEFRLVYTLYGNDHSDAGIEINRGFEGKKKSYIELVFHDLKQAHIDNILGIEEILLSEDEYQIRNKNIKEILKHSEYKNYIKIKEKIFLN
ncbi:DUF2971 domain-containing protein [Clostridium sp. 19966]|uniref:DUF2971 domain-containing protein n=1 Tax=Clostridium sp. 19966 TaxID=2768166 RepID=UPI0028DFC0CF|nr:DUF2971 domain-containing protein [Clostridium sp. 19966]MDT8715532.1 DUF2971 domain-containing protein [Clostridium sp. 19966]